MKYIHRVVKKTRFYIGKLSLSEKDLVKGTLWNILGNGFGKVSILITTIFVAKILGPELFGKWGVIRSTSALFSILLGFGVGVTAIKYVAEYKDNHKEKVGGIIGLTFTLALLLGVFCSFILFVSSEFISLTILQEADLIHPIELSSLLLIFIALNGVLSGCLAGMNSFSSIAFSNFFGGILGALGIIYLSSELGLIGLIYGYILYYLLISMALLFFFQRKLRENKITVSLVDYKQHLSIILHHNVPAILSGGIGGAVVWGVFAYVSRLNMGFSIIGINNAAKIAQNALMEVAAQIDLPIISYLSSSKGGARNNKINLFTPLLIGLIFILPIMYIPEFVGFIFKNSSFDNKDFPLVVSLTMLTTYIMVYKRGMGRSLITLNLMWWGVYENLFWGGLIVTFTYLFVQDLGSIGLALAFTLAYLIDLLVIKPIYYKKGLISKVLISSKEAFFIWTTVLIAPILILTNISLNMRLLMLLLVIIIQCFCLIGVYKRI